MCIGPETICHGGSNRSLLAGAPPASTENPPAQRLSMLAGGYAARKKKVISHFAI
jgi:hypothetical protein